MYSSKTKASYTRFDRYATIVVSLIMIGIVVGGVGYALLQFNATLEDMRTSFEQAGHSLAACFGTAN